MEQGRIVFSGPPAGGSMDAATAAMVSRSIRTSARRE